MKLDLKLLFGLIIVAVAMVIGYYIVNMSNRDATQKTVAEDGNKTRNDVKNVNEKLDEVLTKLNLADKSEEVLIKLLGKDFKNKLLEPDIVESLHMLLQGRTVYDIVEEREMLLKKIQSYTFLENYSELKKNVKQKIQDLKYNEARNIISGFLSSNDNLEKSYKIELYGLLSYFYLNYTPSDVAKAIYWNDKAFNLDKNNHITLIDKAHILDFQGRFEEALDTYNSISENKIEDKVIAFNYYLNKLKTETHLELFLEGKETLIKTENTFNKLPYDVFLKIRLLRGKGDFYFKSREFDYAISNYNDAIELSKLLGIVNHHVASCFTNIGHAYSEIGNHKEALKFHNKALYFMIELFTENSIFYADALNNYGSALVYNGNVDKGITAIEESIRITNKVYGEYYIGNAISYRTLALIYSQFDKKRAHKNAKISKEIFEKTSIKGNEENYQLVLDIIKATGN